MKKLLFILIIGFSLIFASTAFAQVYTLTSGVAQGNKTCFRSNTEKTITVLVAGTVDIALAITEDSEGASTYTETLDTAKAYKYSTNHAFDSVTVTTTITTGTVTSIKLRCTL